MDDTSVADALLPTLEMISRELSTRIEYWNTRKGDANHQIQSIILCGGSVNMKGLPGYFTERLDVDAKRADVWQNAFSLDKKIPAIGKRYSYGYASAVGLALAPFM